MRSKKELAVLLSKLEGFSDPDPRLEQYPTDSEVAAALLWEASLAGDVEGRRLIDLGCGTGILGIGAMALGTGRTVFIDIDPKVLPALMGNIARLEKLTGEEFDSYEIIQGNISNYRETGDTVVTNPPFGTREAHADTAFLAHALTLAPRIYSLHKTSTLPYLRKWLASRDARIEAEYPFLFPLKRTLREHRRKIHRIEVTGLKITA